MGLREDAHLLVRLLELVLQLEESFGLFMDLGLQAAVVLLRTHHRVASSLLLRHVRVV